MKKPLYTILILLSLAGCGKKKTTERVQVDTGYYVLEPNTPALEIDYCIVKNGKPIPIAIYLPFTPLSGGDIGKAEGVR